LLETPAAVWTESAGRPIIHAVNRAAFAQGIQPGLAATAALALCADLRIQPRDEIAEQAALRQLAERALNYTPAVSLDHPAALLLEIRGSLALFGGLESLLAKLRAEFEAAGHAVLLAAAPAPFPAWLLARSGLERVEEKSEALRSRLGGLPLARLPVPRDTVERLAKAGLRTLRDAWRMPRDGLARRYGRDLLRRLDQAAGLEQEPPRLFRPPPRFQAYRALAAETGHLPFLLPVCGLLLHELAEFLRERDAVADRLELELLHFRRPATRLALQLRQGSRDPARLALLLNERLERTPLPAPAIALRLSCDALQTRRAQVDDLFSLPATPGALDMESLLEQLQQRLGREALRFLSAPPDHRPERAWQTADSPGGDTAGVSGRPLWLLPEPRPCDPRRLVLLPGRERIESGWWDGADIRRDYRVGIDERGARLWVYRDLAGSGWYVQGIFA
jgi:protein ImuB